MKLLAADFTESLRRGEPRIEALRTVGDPDPGAAAASFSLALEEPGLAPHAETWVPALLRSARPGRGAERLLAVARAHRKAGGMFDLRRTPSLPLVLGSSDFLARLLVRHPDWVEELETPLSEPTRIEPIAPDWDAIRDAKYRGLLRIAAGDLSNRPFRESLRALSNLADACLISAMQCTARELCASDPPMLFALGKLGGDELNFSSDVDLLFLYDASAGGDNLERNQRAANFIRHLKKRMELPTEKGFIYRVDLDLRPEGVAGALANSVTAALDYYERFGAEWERQMLIRLRSVTGPAALANAFCEGIRPFVYRRSIDPAVLRAVRDMKHRIETERREARGISKWISKRVRAAFATSNSSYRHSSSSWAAARPRFARATRWMDWRPWATRNASRRYSGRTLDRLPLAPSRRTRSTTRRGATDVEIPALPRRSAGARAAHGIPRGLWRRRARAFDRRLESVPRSRARPFRRPGIERRSMSSLKDRFIDAIRGGVLESRLETSAASFLERRSKDAAAARLDGDVLCGLARVLASQPMVAGFLSHRPRLLERIANSDTTTLAARAKELEGASDEHADDLETALDALRIFRREETCLAACLDLGRIIPFEGVSHFLSVLAETIARRALRLAQDELGGAPAVSDFAVLGMGTIAGREFTYHSDLDLIFLCSRVSDDISVTSRVGQRMISYLANMTGAGIAYAVDTRLRPSGRQGVLVTSFDRFESYQLENAETWEHMALLRARAIAGQRTTHRACSKMCVRRCWRAAPNPGTTWKSCAPGSNVRERGRLEQTVALKTGRGGLMDVDFLAAGGVLELRPDRFPLVPSVPAMLNSVAQGSKVARLLEDYALLRLVESRARLIAGRSVEDARTDGDELALLGELVDPDIEPSALLEEISEAQERIRAAFESVVERDAISALSD